MRQVWLTGLLLVVLGFGCPAAGLAKKGGSDDGGHSGKFELRVADDDGQGRGRGRGRGHDDHDHRGRHHGENEEHRQRYGDDSRGGQDDHRGQGRGEIEIHRSGGHQ